MSQEATTWKIGAEPVKESPLDATYRQRTLFTLMVRLHSCYTPYSRDIFVWFISLNGLP